MSEEVEPNLDLSIDLRFAGIEAELYVVLQHRETVERQLPHLVETERARLEHEELSGINDEYEYHSIRNWIDEFVEEVLPRLYRYPIVVELWAVFESGIIEIAKYLQTQQGHSISVHDLRSNNDFERSQKYYELVLQFPLIVSNDIQERLNMLLLIRNAVAHCNGRIEVIREQRLRRIRAWEDRYGVCSDGVYVTFTAAFLEGMAAAVSTALEDLITRVKEKY